MGNLHLARAEWEEDSLEWLLGGAYGDLSSSVSELSAVPTLTLWGRQDEVIPPAGFGAWPVARLKAALPGGEFRWVESSGHTPHLEQPAFTAEALVAFTRGEAIGGESDASEVVAAAARFDAAKDKALELADAAAEKAKQLGSLAFERAKNAMAADNEKGRDL